MTNFIFLMSNTAPFPTPDPALAPGLGTKHTKLAATDVPQVHVLTNPALVKKHTRLVALDDTVVAKARTTEKEEEARKSREAKEGNEGGEEDASVAVHGRLGGKRRRMG